MPTNDAKAKQELIKAWEEHCEENSSEKEIVKEFEGNYISESAIKWYTRESFLYRILNRALRNFEPDVLFGLRFFLVDLYQQLTDEHQKFVRTYGGENPIIKVYRGQAIALNELNLIQDSKGEFISFNNFLSTSTNEKTGKSFAQQSPDTENLTRVLFQFDIDTRLLDTKSYADISKVSFYEEESEVLLMLGSIFRIEEVNYDEEERMWIVKLTLCDENEYEIKQMIEHMKKQLCRDHISFGYLLYRQGQYEKAKQFFSALLEEETTTKSQQARCLWGLGTVAKRLKQWDQALNYFQNELRLRKILDDATDIAVTYSRIGEVYWYKQDLHLALLYEQKALDILLPLNHSELSTVYRTMANVFRDKMNFNSALQHYHKAMEVDLQHRPKNHDKFGTTFENVGKLYEKKGDHNKALHYYHKAREIYSKSLPDNHPDIITLEQSINNAQSKLV